MPPASETKKIRFREIRSVTSLNHDSHNAELAKRHKIFRPIQRLNYIATYRTGLQN